jgi:hypothetical protein
MADDADIIVTDTDRQMANDALVAGARSCPRVGSILHGRSNPEPPCDCGEGILGACKSVNEAVAHAIATARKI